MVFLSRACFIIQTRTTSARVKPPTVGWVFPLLSVIKKMPPKGLPLDQLDGRIFSIKIPSSEMTLAYSKLTKPNQIKK